jgi:hypothetical protein
VHIRLHGADQQQKKRCVRHSAVKPCCGVRQLLLTEAPFQLGQRLWSAGRLACMHFCPGTSTYWELSQLQAA